MKKTIPYIITVVFLVSIVDVRADERTDNNVQEALNAELVKAAKSGNVIMYKGFLKQGADFNKATGDGGENTLNIAAAKGHSSIVKFLIEKKKINVNIKSGEFKMPPLFMASSGNHLAIIKYLIRKGARVNLKNRMGRSSIFVPAGKGYLSVVKYLVSKGAAVNVAGRYGLTPLHLAARGNRLAMVKYLVQRGADPNVKNLIEGKTPADMARGRVKRYLLRKTGKR